MNTAEVCDITFNSQKFTTLYPLTCGKYNRIMLYLKRIFNKLVFLHRDINEE
ncbi:MAG: hypothetical protein K0S30_2277 [Clostridia bacterium]|jgi:hypothetical protein|nr:hypothetical protein [Clostridia bacterium]